jgi:hypothetical protein
MLNNRHSQELEVAITRYMADHGIDRTEAVRRVLNAWFSENGYFPSANARSAPVQTAQQSTNGNRLA